jgi:SAM-dependent methyltransferase
MAQGWDDRHAYFEETARPVAERMLQRLAPAPGQAILELAAGTGVVGFAAAALVGSGGRVIVSDFSQAMVVVAERRAVELGLENVECRVLDAERLELPDAAVDGVLCRWGYMLMANPKAAFVETRRVLRRGGRLSCAVFAGAAKNPWVALPSGVLQERGHMPPPQAGAPGILALADRDRLRRLFVGVGFSEPHLDEVAFVWRFRDPDEYWQFLTGVFGGSRWFSIASTMTSGCASARRSPRACGRSPARAQRSSSRRCRWSRRRRSSSPRSAASTVNDQPHRGRLRGGDGGWRGRRVHRRVLRAARRRGRPGVPVHLVQALRDRGVRPHPGEQPDSGPC